MHRIPKIGDLPNSPAVYVLFAGKKANIYPVYVGIADKLRQRLSQHLIRRDSSITTGASIITLNPDYITEIRWWEYPDFSERAVMEAAEEIAFDIFNPVLRSRGKLTSRAQELTNDKQFREKMKNLFSSSQSGRKEFLDFQDVIELIDELNSKLNSLDEKVSKIEGKL